MKEKFKFIGLGLAVFIGIFLLAFFLMFLFLDIFYNFNLLSATVLFFTSLGCSVLVAVLFSWYFIARLKAAKSTRFSRWLSQNYPKLILLYVVLSIIFLSIKTEIIWSYDSLKNVISLEWTIFGISITIFLVWNVIILKYLEKAKPTKSDKMCSIEKIDYITKKEVFYSQASVTFNTVTLLIINLLILVLSTAMVFIVAKEKVTLFCQNVVIISFYLSCNTIVELLLDILKPFNEEKKAILSETKVTANEIKEKEEIEEQLLQACRILKNLEQLESIDEEQKSKMKTEIVMKALGINYPLEEEENNHNGSESK